FVVGEVALDNPGLVKAIHNDGHEIASHSWDHRRIIVHTPGSFRQDVTTSKDALEQITGEVVIGYRAPTFSVVRGTAWALDELADAGFLYDSSIYPVKHDRYGISDAPRSPFIARGERSTILEIPPLTGKVMHYNLPAAGGGYFRLFPLWFMNWAIRQSQTHCRPAVAMLYFHPWEFDPGQDRLPLGFLSAWRTYVGIRHSRARFATLLSRYQFTRAKDVVEELQIESEILAMPAMRMAA
ncbi:MAG: DUF3473 domain-containing protein, partial [Candidatus Acidiferrum sp.]